MWRLSRPGRDRTRTPGDPARLIEEANLGNAVAACRRLAFASLFLTFLFVCAPRAQRDRPLQWERPIADAPVPRLRRDGHARLDAYRRSWQSDNSRFAK